MAVTKFVRYTTEVDTMNEAWVFIMEHMDLIESPDIEIKSVTVVDMSDPDSEWTDKVQAIIYGEEKTNGA